MYALEMQTHFKYLYKTIFVSQAVFTFFFNTSTLHLASKKTWSFYSTNKTKTRLIFSSNSWDLEFPCSSVHYANRCYIAFSIYFLIAHASTIIDFPKNWIGDLCAWSKTLFDIHSNQTKGYLLWFNFNKHQQTSRSHHWKLFTL